MERIHRDRLWSLMADNSVLHHNTWDDHLPQNPISSQNFVYQNLVYQNPDPPLQTHSYQMNIGSLESGLQLNPSFAEPLQNFQSLESALSRMNISAPPPHQSHFLENNYLTNRGFAHLSYPQQQPLNRMRSISAGLGLRRANSTWVHDRPYQNMASLNQSFSNFSINNSRSNLERRSPCYDSLNYRYSASPYANHRGIRLDSDSQFSRGRSVYGLESSNSNILLSSLYYRQLAQSGRRANYTSLEQVKGRVALISRDQEGCRFLQRKIDERKPEQTEMIFLELKDHLCDLVVDQFANYVVQKLFGACNEEQMSQLLLCLIKNEQKLLDICIHPHGTRAMQKMIEHMRTPEQRSLLISAMKCIALSLCKNHNGHHVIQQCFKYFMVDDTKHLLDEILKSCLDIAMDKSGCCVLQKSVTEAQGELRERLVAEITANALVLSENPFGNYVVQYVLEMKIPHAEANILENLKGNYVTLSMNKYGSNVVERCLRGCNEKNASEIIEELMYSSEFLDVLQDPFGNYVVQSALLVSKGDLHHTLVELINIYSPHLHSHLHGKKVLARTQRKTPRRYRARMRI
ncbi:hypothetical protein P3X46_013776 [Hevea brasiliensis]|uniref:PUM-HD domain-containing protein n=1 Tax=Hevea brasiliensis TaxID=3981 RepID=A0ABQ9M6C7_HEVBR|nr:pumilio homolog 12-like [Hevea brasiliensis]KAJ9175198.1 hypothetical protein P3X46_013776 [Hevea brasiliensis]